MGVVRADTTYRMSSGCNVEGSLEGTRLDMETLVR